MIAEEIYLETVSTQFHHFMAELEQLKAKMDLLPYKVSSRYEPQLKILLDEKVRLETILKNLSLAPAQDRQRIKVEVAQEFDLLQKDLAHFKEDVMAAEADAHRKSIGWAEGQAEDDPVESIGWAEGQADADPVESIGWAEGQAEDDPVESIGWAEGYKHK